MLIERSGEFWTIKYLKSVSERLKALLNVTDPNKNDWVATKNGIPKILWPILKDIDLGSVQGRTLILRLTAIPKGIKPSSLNRDDLVKLRNSIRAPRTAYPKDLMSSLLRDGVSSMLGYTGPRSVESPTIFQMGRSSFDLESDEFLDQVQYAWRTPYKALLATHVNPYSPFEEPFWMGVTTQDPIEAPTAGTIGLTPESGGKVRLFASPSLHVRWLTHPLMKMSREVLKLVPEDCTYDQEKFKIFLLDCIAKNLVVMSIDQSSATDLFPVEIIALVAILLGLPSGAIEEFMDLSSKNYKVPRSASILADSSGCISWERGQPLGVYPSFNLYALAHHALVRGVFRRLNKPFKYRILGDDIAIADREVGEEYVRIMELIGCSINKAKTYTSSVYAEGAGYRVYADVAVAPGRFPIADQFNYQSFVKDDLLRKEILVNLPGSEDNPIVAGKLTRESVIRLLAAQMEHGELRDKLRYFLACQTVSFKSISLEYPELFKGREAQADQAFYLNVVKTLKQVRDDVSSNCRHVIDRLVPILSETMVWYVFSSDELGRLISTLPILRDITRTPYPLWEKVEKENLGYNLLGLPSSVPCFVPSDTCEVQQWKAQKAEVEKIEKRLETLSLLEKVPGFKSDRSKVVQELERAKSRLGLFEGPDERTRLEIPSSYLDFSETRDKVSMDVRVIRQELKVAIANVLQSNGALNTPSNASEFRRVRRKLNNCLKLSGFKRIIREYL